MKKIQLTLEEYEAELHESTYTQIFFNKYCKSISLSYDFLINIFFSLLYHKNTATPQTEVQIQG